MRILWLSANRFGYELLHEAVKTSRQHIIGIITLSEKAKTVMYDGIDRKMWDKFGLPVYEVGVLNDEAELLRKLNPDIIIMCGWRQILSKEILSIPKLGVIGFHPTLLPIGRGPAPIINSIMCGFRHSGVTMFYASEGLDDGDIIGQEKFDIGDNDYAHDVYCSVLDAGRELVRKYLPLLIKGNAPRIKQGNTKVVIFNKVTLADNDMTDDNIGMMHQKIRAFSSPYRGAYIKKDGKKLIVWKADLV